MPNIKVKLQNVSMSYIEFDANFFLLLTYHYEIQINFCNDSFPHPVSDIIYCSILVPYYILVKNRQAGKTVRLSLNLGEGHGT